MNATVRVESNEHYKTISVLQLNFVSKVISLRPNNGQHNNTKKPNISKVLPTNSPEKLHPFANKSTSSAGSVSFPSLKTIVYVNIAEKQDRPFEM